MSEYTPQAVLDLAGKVFTNGHRLNAAFYANSWIETILAQETLTPQTVVGVSEIIDDWCPTGKKYWELIERIREWLRTHRRFPPPPPPPVYGPWGIVDLRPAFLDEVAQPADAIIFAQTFAKVAQLHTELNPDVTKALNDSALGLTKAAFGVSKK